MMNLPQMPLDLLFEADRQITLEGQFVRRWHPVKGKGAFLEQPEGKHQPKLIVSGDQPVIRFDGKSQHLFFRAFGAEKGPHTFIFACRTQSGLLFDSQHGGPTVPAPKAHWQVYEVIQDSEMPINGETVLGANYYGNAGFLKGDIAAIGYKQGILARGQRQYIKKLFEAKLGEAEKGYWSFHIPKPQWLKFI